MQEDLPHDDQDLELAIEGVAAHPEPDGNLRVLMATSMSRG